MPRRAEAAPSRSGDGRLSGPPPTAAPARMAVTCPRRPVHRRKPHPYAGDPRLARVLAGLRAGEPLSTVDLAGEWGVSRRTAARILRAARDQLEQ